LLLTPKNKQQHLLTPGGCQQRRRDKSEDLIVT
jgi:hypothetical protein